MEEKKIWSMDELVALTDEVQINEVVFRGKLVEFQYCELTEQELGSQRVLKMIQKANEKNPDGPVIVEEQWSLLPTTLRYAISNKILGAEDTAAVNFQN